MKNTRPLKNTLWLVMVAVVVIGISCKQQKKTTDDATTGKVEAVSVKVKKVQIQPFYHYLELTGNVSAVQSAFISPQINGQVLAVNVEDGDVVTAGQSLVEINSTIIRNSISEVESQLALATTTYEKQKELYEKKITSEIQFLQVKTQKEALEKKLATLQEQLSFTKVLAPFSGIVENIRIKVGELAAPGRQLLELVNLNKMKILADVSESYIAKIHIGDSVEVRFPDYPSLQYHIPIYRKSNIINPSSRTFSIELRFLNKNKLVKPNMIANLRLCDYATDSALVVPSIIIKKDFDKSFVFVMKHKDGKTIAEKITVETGQSYDGNTMITRGLSENDAVIVDGYNQIVDGSVVESVK